MIVYNLQLLHSRKSLIQFSSRGLLTGIRTLPNPKEIKLTDLATETEIAKFTLSDELGEDVHIVAVDDFSVIGVSTQRWNQYIFILDFLNG